MLVYFLRHGAAIEASRWRGSDFERPLTEEGRKQLEEMAKAIGRLSLELDAVITSPLVRAKETATIFARAVGMVGGPIADERVAGLNPERLADILCDWRDASAIVLVGHEPDMSSTVGAIIGGASIDFKKGALACVKLRDRASPRGDLLWLAPPKFFIVQSVRMR